MNAGEILARLRADTSPFQRGLKEAQQQLQGFGRGLQGEMQGLDRTTARAFAGISASTSGSIRVFAGLRGALAATAAAFAALGVAKAAKEIFDAGVRLQKLENTLKTVTGSTATAAETIGFLRKEAQRLGLDFTSSSKAFAGLAAAAKPTSLGLEGAKEIFSAVAEASTVLGLSADQTEGALLALQQMMSKGTVAAEELRGQLGERLPGAFQIAAKAMGVTTAALNKMLEQGLVRAEVFLPRFAKALRAEFSQGVPLAAQSAQAALNRFGNAMEELKQRAARGGLLQGVQEGLEALARELKDPKTIKAAEEAGWAIGKAFSVGVRAAIEAADILGARDVFIRLSTGQPPVMNPPISPARQLDLLAKQRAETEADIRRVEATLGRGSLARLRPESPGERAEREEALARLRLQLEGIVSVQEDLQRSFRSLEDLSAESDLFGMLGEEEATAAAMGDALDKRTRALSDATKGVESLTKALQQELAVSRALAQAQFLPRPEQIDAEIKTIKGKLDEFVKARLAAQETLQKTPGDVQAQETARLAGEQVQQISRQIQDLQAQKIGAVVTQQLALASAMRQLVGPSFNVASLQVKAYQEQLEAMLQQTQGRITPAIRRVAEQLQDAKTSLRDVQRAEEEAAFQTQLFLGDQAATGLEMANVDVEGHRQSLLAMRDETERVARALQDAAAQAQIFAQDFDVLSARTQALRAELQALITQGLRQGLTPEAMLASDRIQELRRQFETLRGVERLRDVFMEVFNGIGQAINTAKNGVIQGTQTLGDAFKRLGQTVILGFAQAIIKKGLEPLQQAVGQFFASLAQEMASSGGGGGIGGFFKQLLIGFISGVAGGAAGGAVAPSGGGGGGPSIAPAGFTTLPRLAAGAIVSRSTLAVIGEAGPEAVVPLDGGALPLELEGEGGLAMLAELVGIGAGGPDEVALHQTIIVVRNRQEAEHARQAAVGRRELVTVVLEDLEANGPITKKINETFRLR